MQGLVLIERESILHIKNIERSLERNTLRKKARLAEMRKWYANLHLFDNAFCSVSTKNVEADDLLSLYYFDLTELGYDVTVASKDKDLITAVLLKDLMI